MYRLVNHPSFNLFIFIVIGANTIILSLDIYSLDSGTIEIRDLEYFNYCFFAIFALESIIKLIGLGFREFVKDKFNIFDVVVVIVSLVEIILSNGSGKLTSLRAFRLFRVFKVFRVGDLRILIDCLTKSMKAISPFVICLLLFMYIFTLMSMQFFAGELKFNADDLPDPTGKSVRYNFDTFFNAFISIFIILTGEGWNEIMYDTMRSVGDQAALFFIAILVLGNMIMIQLLVAIVITNFDESHKIASKRKIIDSIEDKMELGKTVYEAMHMVIGNVFSIEHHDEEGEGNLRVKLGKQKLTIARSKYLHHKYVIESTKAISEPFTSLKKVT